MNEAKGELLRRHLKQGNVVPFIGVYDVFSASLAAETHNALFISGFGFSASHYGLPDAGFIAWSDLLDFVCRVRVVVPSHHLLVDIDDGYCDTAVACHVVKLLERNGASGVVLEDQARPRRCGHLDGKQVLPLEDYLEKLRAVLACRSDLFVVARTDASEPEEIKRRVIAFCEAGADAVLADGIKTLDELKEIRSLVDCTVIFNQIAGGKSPLCNLTALKEHGANLVIYSTPCLFAAQSAVRNALAELVATDGSLEGAVEKGNTLAACNKILNRNLNQAFHD
jgi:2-methylisocitrate lyase-like PEP mutase family enzyme